MVARRPAPPYPQRQSLRRIAMPRFIPPPAILLATALLAASAASAGEARVVAATATPGAHGWRLDVTVAHADAGWDHYADAWEVTAPDGAVLGVRELLHPHDDEQPFTRSLTGVAIPEGVDHVTIRARDSVHGWGPPFMLRLPR